MSFLRWDGRDVKGSLVIFYYDCKMYDYCNITPEAASSFMIQHYDDG